MNDFTTLLWALGILTLFIGSVLLILFGRQEKTNTRVATLEINSVKYDFVRTAIKDAVEGMSVLFDVKDAALKENISRVDANVTKIGEKMDVDNKQMMTLLGTIRGAAQQSPPGNT